MEEDPLASRFVDAAERIARYILTRRIDNQNDPRFGLVTGGDGSYTVRLHEESGKPVEEYDPSAVGWASTEHNIDAYFFLRDLGTLTGDDTYTTAADLIRNGLRSLWSEEEGQFYRGIRETGALDTALPLDCATWGAMFLVATGDDEKARRCLETAEMKFASEHDGLSGYKPYHSGPIYEETAVNGYFSGTKRPARWEHASLVWGEGSFGLSAAYLKTGNGMDAYRIVHSLLPLQTDGGFLYSTTDIPFQFSTHPSVASTAWFIIAVESLLDEGKKDIFWGRGR